MARVAIIGSCITRDLWPTRGDSPGGPMYVSRTSLASLLASPLLGFTPTETLPGELRRHQHRALVADLQKTALAQLVAFQPTHLIFDFIDERFDLLSAGGTLLTHSWELEASGYLAQPAFAGARPVPRLSVACESLWRAAAEEFAALIRATPLHKARLILHSARWATESRGESGRRRPIRDVEILTGRPADTGAHNALLARYEAAFEAFMPPLERVEAPDWRVADEAHQWGLSPFHYVPAYYEEIWRQLEALGALRPPTPASALPSAPAA
jgi:hypothetical protein